jgi:hypothetical protein
LWRLVQWIVPGLMVPEVEKLTDRVDTLSEEDAPSELEDLQCQTVQSVWTLNRLFTGHLLKGKRVQGYSKLWLWKRLATLACSHPLDGEAQVLAGVLFLLNCGDCGQEDL